MAVCESCWAEAERRQACDPSKAVTDYYYEVMHERQEARAPCTRAREEEEA